MDLELFYKVPPTGVSMQDGDATNKHIMFVSKEDILELFQLSSRDVYSSDGTGEDFFALGVF